MKKTMILTLVLLVGLAFVGNASAYYDPSTGTSDRVNDRSVYHDPSTGMPNRVEAMRTIRYF